MAKTVRPNEVNDSALVQKGLPCLSDQCGSSDGMALYDDGHSYCFACSTRFKGDGAASPQPTAPRGNRDVEVEEFAQQGRPLSIKSRGISQATCRHWDYKVWEKPSGEFVQLATYKNAQGLPVGVKVRPEDKDKIHWGAGSAKGNLYGRWLWNSGGKRLVVTEGELDALSVSQAYNNKYPVVSVPNGAAEAAKAIAANLDYVGSFEEVVFFFDADTPGQEAAIECARLLPPGKAKIAKAIPGCKDASDMLQKDLGDKITWAIHSAEGYRPDGIIDARTLSAACKTPVVWGFPWPWDELTGFTYGRRFTEVYTLGSGTGMGKSDALCEIIAADLQGKTKSGQTYQPQSWGVFGYESGPTQTKKQIAGKIAGRRFHIPPEEGGIDWTPEELDQTLTLMDTTLWDNGGQLFINDSFGASDWSSVVERARYLRHAFGVRHFLVDPLSALVTGEDDERKLLDAIVLEAAALTHELTCCFYIVSHLTRPAMGPSHEEGGHVQLRQFRGSNGIGMSSSFVIGLERNQQAEDASERSKTTVRIVKDRYTGNSTGKTMGLRYDALTGLLDPDTYVEPFAPSFIGDL